MADQGKAHRRKQKPARAGDTKDAGLETWVQLAYAYHRIARRLEQALDEFNISLAQLEVLCRLNQKGEMTQTELAQCLLVTKGNVCGLVDRMAAAGLVTRKNDPVDRRANKLTMTQAGTSLYAELMPQHVCVIERLFRALTTRELQALCRTLTKLAPAGHGATE